MWIFLEANLQSRLILFYYAQLTDIFYHWVVGTMFMYGLLVLVFIRDS